MKGDGTYRTRPVRLSRAGFYSYTERVVGTGVVKEAVRECGIVAETTLAAPLILTGRGDAPTAGRTAHANGARPTRVRIPGLRIDTPVANAGIDIRAGALDVPISVQRAGWWVDGAAPGDRRGAVLIAGHVDSARAGAGAFFRLKNATSRDRVEVRTSDGRVQVYRVISVRQYVKARLPASVFSTGGRHRLVLVTCGGPFLRGEGAYRDNIVVTAVPA